jgi:uncharacterized protein YjiK
MFSGCDTQSQEKALSIDGFDWSKKKIIELQPELNEISGITYDWNKNCFLAINDEQGILFVLHPGDFKIQQELKFGKKGDYECVTINGEKVFVLKSNGDVCSIALDKDSITQSIVSFYSGPATEFEACIWNSERKILNLISKKSSADKEVQANNIYSYNPVNGEFLLENVAKVSWDKLREEGLTIKAFHPSGATVEPATGNIYVVSSIEKLLVIFKPDWTVISVHLLDEKIFRQPEGVSFDKAGNLLVTNEAGGGKPTLIFIPTK